MAEILVFDPNNFEGDPITNPFLPLAPGNTWVYADSEGAVDTVTVTNQTINILGVECIVVKDVAKDGNKILESTKDYFAQDLDGNVWYFGENTKEFLEGGGVSFEGTWRGGVDGAQPGILMLADPRKGDSYLEENAPGVAVDRAEVRSLNASATVQFGSFDDCVKTRNTSELFPGDVEFKFYAAGVGSVLEIASDGTRTELQSFTTSTLAAAHHADPHLVQAMASFGGREHGSGPAFALHRPDESGLSHTLAAHSHDADHGRQA